MAFLGIRITKEISRLLAGIDLPGEKTAPSDMHITILHFEENWPIDQIAHALEATYDVVSHIKPFIAMTEDITCFEGKEQAAIVALVKAAELHELHDKLAKEFDKCNLEYSKIFKDYKPHITLSYNKDKIDNFSIDPVEFSVAEIVLWCGDNGDDRIFITFPLKGPEKQKHAVLMQKTDMFYKLANNPSQDYFLPTRERRKEDR